MVRYVSGRVAQAVVTILFSLLVVFLIVRMTGDPAVLFLSPESTPEDYQRFRHQLGLDRPLPLQFLIFVRDFAQGDMGESIRFRRPVVELIRQAAPVTLELACFAVFLSVLIGVPLGILTAVRRGSVLDQAGMLFALVGQAMPTFWIALLLIMFFVERWQLIKITTGPMVLRLLLPAIALGWFSAASIVRLTRSNMLDILDSEYIKLARLKGLPERVVLFKHGLRNAAIPVVTLVSLQLAALVGGTVIIETIFALPGLGRLAIDAINSRDYAVVQAVVIVIAILYTGMNLLVDLLYGVIDPRIRYG